MKERFGVGLVFSIFILVLTNQPVSAGWIQYGTIVCNAQGEQRYVSAVPDGSGGAIVVWEDHRNNWSVIYAQRMDANGEARWTGNGMKVCTTSPYKQGFPVAVSDGSGGVIVVWMDYRYGTDNARVFAQRIDGGGNRLWLAAGVPVCPGGYFQGWPCIVPDGSGGAVIGWMDYRAVGGTPDIYAQRLDNSGAAMWAVAGVPVCTANSNQDYPVAASDGAGGAFFAWNDLRTADVEIRVQKIDSLGAPKWYPNGVTFFSAINEQWLQIVPDGGGGAIVCWTDVRGGEEDIFAERVDKNGALAWDRNGVAVCNLGSDEYQPAMIPDGAGGAIVAWTNGNIFAQRITGSGSRLWPSAGVRMGAATYTQRDCALVSDGAGGAIVAWTDGGIFGQRVSPNGVVLWREDGVYLCTASTFAYNPAIVADGWGGAVVAWQDERMDFGEVDLYAMRVDADGSRVATLLESYAAGLTGDGIRITWRLSEIDRDVSFIVMRSAGETGPFEELASSGVVGDGLSFSFTDTECEAGATYWYRVDVCVGGERRELFRTGPVETPSMAFALYQNAPNPFNPATTIRFYLPEWRVVTLDVYDAGGRLVRRLAEGSREKGIHSASWDGRDAAGREAGSGMYFARLKAGKEIQSRKMILLR